LLAVKSRDSKFIIHKYNNSKHTLVAYSNSLMQISLLQIISDVVKLSSVV